MERDREHPNTMPEVCGEFRVKTETYHDGIFAAPVLIAVLGDKEAKRPGHLVHGGPLAAANLMLPARALGYGTVYGTDFVSARAQRDALGIPDR